MSVDMTTVCGIDVKRWYGFCRVHDQQSSCSSQAQQCDMIAVAPILISTMETSHIVTAIVTAIVAAMWHCPVLQLGISAPQGCGKSTLVEQLEQLFTWLGVTAASVSVDDFYLTNTGDCWGGMKPCNIPSCLVLFLKCPCS